MLNEIVEYIDETRIVKMHGNRAKKMLIVASSLIYVNNPVEPIRKSYEDSTGSDMFVDMFYFSGGIKHEPMIVNSAESIVDMCMKQYDERVKNRRKGRRISSICDVAAEICNASERQAIEFKYAIKMLTLNKFLYVDTTVSENEVIERLVSIIPTKQKSSYDTSSMKAFIKTKNVMLSCFRRMNDLIENPHSNE